MSIRLRLLVSLTLLSVTLVSITLSVRKLRIVSI